MSTRFFGCAVPRVADCRPSPRAQAPARHRRRRQRRPWRRTAGPGQLPAVHTAGQHLRAAAHAGRSARHLRPLRRHPAAAKRRDAAGADGRTVAANRANGEFSYSLNERPKLPEGAIVRPAGVDPADGKIPLKPEALAKRKEIIANQEKIEHLDGRVLCLAPGMPRSTIPAPVVGYQIFQKPGYVVIFYEQSHLYRTIPLDGRPPLDPAIRKAMGVSRGHWEGNSLVVEVTNFTNNSREQLGDRRGVRHAGHSGGVADHGPRHSAQRPVSGDRALHADRREHHPLRGEDHRREGVHAAVDGGVVRVRAGAEGLRAGRYACFEGNEKNLLLMTNTDISDIRVNVP